jgi:RimJ/RimL family protein N-acetyltransferase
VVWSRLPGEPDQPIPRDLPDLPGGRLTDGVVTLRRLGIDDAADLFALQSLPEVIATTVRADPPGLIDAMTRCERVGYQWLLGNRAEFSIRDATTDAFAGDIGLMNQQVTGQAMIGYSVGREWRGRGFATRAARLVADWAFDACGIVRVVAGTAPGNIGSQRVLAGAGFRREGYERSRLPGPDGTRVDNLSYALLPEDRTAA